MKSEHGYQKHAGHIINNHFPQKKKIVHKTEEFYTDILYMLFSGLSVSLGFMCI